MPGYRNVPDFVRGLIARCESDQFYVGRTASYSVADLVSGELAQLGIICDGESASADRVFLPPVARGLWSKYNVDGWTNVRRELPKISKGLVVVP